MTIALHAIHLLAWGVGYGAITYTHYRLNQVMRRFTRSDAEYEAYIVATAGRLHWWTFGALVLAGVSGAALLFMGPARSVDAAGSWPAPLVAKALLLIVMLAVQGYVIAVMQPRRARAPLTASPVQDRRAFRAALVLGFLYLVQLVLGTLAHVSTPHAHG